MKKNSVLILLSILFCSFSCFSQDTLLITYEPFKLNYRIPTSPSNIISSNTNDTITEKSQTDSIIELFEKTIVGEGEIANLAGIKLICRVKKGKDSYILFYYLSSRELYYNGLIFKNDYGLLEVLLSSMKVDDMINKEIEDIIHKYELMPSSNSSSNRK